MSELQDDVASIDKDEADRKLHERWYAAALCLGFNELAKMGKTLGEKVYFRMFRHTAEDEFIRLGGKRVYQEEPSILTLKLEDGMPYIEFPERDIELMRATVAAYDAKKKETA